VSKLATLAEAVASIPWGAHLALSGFAITRCNMAFAREVIRQGLKRLTVSQCVGAMDADLLAGAGAIDRLIYGGGSLDKFGRLANVNRRIENGTLCAEEHSSLSIAFRYLAGALGLPFIPIRSLGGSDLLGWLDSRDASAVATVTDPFTGEPWRALQPLQPDVAIVQVQKADAQGNAWILGPRWDNLEQVRASKRAIVITEEVVSTDELRSRPELTVIPGLMVSHVVALPFGAHPTSVYQCYDYDAAHIEEYVQASATPQSFREYLERYVFGVPDDEAYLALASGPEGAGLRRARPELGY
jgi:acyl CoA:acetate/3-ketoacid CoA transferase alpha subunit